MTSVTLVKPTWRFALAAMVGGVVVAGCDMGPVDDTPVSVAPIPAELREYQPELLVGNPVPADPMLLANLLDQVQRTPANARPDPFALLPAEARFDADQESARLMSMLGFDRFFPPEEEVVLPPVREQQPYRRLSGVIVGDNSVVAIMEADDRAESVLLRPGMRIPNSPWQVITIDEEKAVLRRQGSPNVLPREVTVRLEGRPGGVTMPGGPGFPGMGGPPGGGGGAFRDDDF